MGGLVWRDGKTGFKEQFYSIVRGSLLSDRLLVRSIKAMPQIQKYLSATEISACCQRILLVIKDNPPRLSSQGDAPHWSIMESKVWNESRFVLNCLLRWIIVQTKGSLYTACGRYRLLLDTCTVESADGWNTLTAVQRKAE